MVRRMTRQTAAPLEEYSLTILASNAREVARLVLDGDMDVAPPYQRQSVWTPAQRMNLVESWLRRIPIPAIIINDRTGVSHRGKWQGPIDYAYALVDGRQRVETAVRWFTSKLPVPASWFPAKEIATAEDTADGPYVRYDGLTLSGQRRVAFDFTLPRADAKLLTVREEASLYVLLNSAGTAQTAADLNNARKIADGAF